MVTKKEQLSGYPDEAQSRIVARFLEKKKWKKSTLVMEAVMEYIKKHDK